MKRFKLFNLILSMLIIMIYFPTDINSTSSSKIYIDFDKTTVLKGDTISATIHIENINKFAGFHVNLKYDPQVLQAIDLSSGKPYDSDTLPEGGTVIVNMDYYPISAVSNDISIGQINFGRTYTLLKEYKERGQAEESGILARIGFKVLQEKDTKIIFENSSAMPYGISGTMLFEWDGNRVSDYKVIQPERIVARNTQSSTPVNPGGTGSSPDSSQRVDPPVPTVTPTTTPAPTKLIPSEIDEEQVEIPGAYGEHKAYLRGYPDGTFRPENSITRAEAAVILAKLLGADENANYTSSIIYNDLDDRHWAVWAIEYVSEKELFKGYPDGTFMPNQNITRAEFATVIFKTIQIMDNIEERKIYDNIFTDTIGHWAQQFIEQLSDMGYINGYPDRTFKPNNMIKRSESVALVNRALERGPLYGAPIIFEDVTENHWAFRDISSGVLDYKYIIDDLNREMLVEILSEF
ncbi:UNVERIFIED_CONTAM: S-layer family protein [Acetivibrio alkalicellulosi]